MQLPEIVQCVLNSSSNDVSRDAKRGLPVQMAFQLICCQMGKATRSRKSIASFQLRRGNLLGYAAHLRGAKIYSFLDQYIFLVSPRPGTLSESAVKRKSSPFATPRAESTGGDTGKKDQVTHYTFGKESFTLFPGLEAHFLAFSTVGGFNCTLSAAPCEKKGLEWLLAALQFPIQP